MNYFWAIIVWLLSVYFLSKGDPAIMFWATLLVALAAMAIRARKARKGKMEIPMSAVLVPFLWIAFYYLKFFFQNKLK